VFLAKREITKARISQRVKQHSGLFLPIVDHWLVLLGLSVLVLVLAVLSEASMMLQSQETPAALSRPGTHQ
jgi:hypothetical protein